MTIGTSFQNDRFLNLKRNKSLDSYFKRLTTVTQRRSYIVT